MTGIKFKHANLPGAIYVSKELVVGMYYSDSHKCTHIIGPGGAIIPVAESLDDAVRMVYGTAGKTAISPNGGANNGT